MQTGQATQLMYKNQIYLSFFLACLAYLLWTILQFVFQDLFFNYSIKLSLKWYFYSDLLRVYFKRFSDVFFYSLLGGFCLLFFFLRDKTQATQSLFMFYLFLTPTMTFKNLFFRARPCLISE